MCVCVCNESQPADRLNKQRANYSQWLDLESKSEKVANKLLEQNNTSKWLFPTRGGIHRAQLPSCLTLSWCLLLLACQRLWEDWKEMKEMHDCNACATQIDCLISSWDTAGICSSQLMCLDNSVSVNMSPESHHSFSLLWWWLLVEVYSKTETSVYLTTRCFPDISILFVQVEWCMCTGLYSAMKKYLPLPGSKSCLYCSPYHRREWFKQSICNHT